LRDPGISNRQRGEFELDAEACQSRPVFAERMDEHCRWIGVDAGKFIETCDENAQWHRFHACEVQAGLGFSIPRVQGEIPWTTCYNESAFGYFEMSFLGIGECKSIWRVP